MAAIDERGAWTLAPDRCFDPEPAQRSLARQLYAAVKELPLVSPHGHVDPSLLAEDRPLGSPAELFIIPDHYVYRMLYSQGVPLEELGVPTRDGTPVEQDHRRIWQRFAEHFHLFRATPTGLWLQDELVNVFGVTEKLTAASADRIYDHLQAQLERPEFRPRALFARFNLEVLCTTDGATDGLEHHRALRAAGWQDRVRPTFRPDAVVNLDAPNWRAQLDRLSELAAIDIVDYISFIRALETRREVFKQLGATATDHSAATPYTARLTPGEAGAIFTRALYGNSGPADAARFTAHMLLELARMSTDDGLVMQLHIGSYRNHNTSLFERFGPDKGADIPIHTEWTYNLHALLNAYGNDSRYRLILFTLDESSYSRELAPIAGHYPAVLLGPPWWFYDSINGMRRYLDRIVETAGLYNLAGFNDDTRAFASIPARHDIWRRVTCNWLAGQVLHGLLDEEDAFAMAVDCAYTLAKRAYRLEPAEEQR
jgi:glucuronate isomerase